MFYHQSILLLVLIVSCGAPSASESELSDVVNEERIDRKITESFLFDFNRCYDPQNDEGEHLIISYEASDNPVNNVIAPLATFSCLLNFSLAYDGSFEKIEIIGQPEVPPYNHPFDARSFGIEAFVNEDQNSISLRFFAELTPLTITFSDRVERLPPNLIEAFDQIKQLMNIEPTQWISPLELEVTYLGLLEKDNDS